MMLYRVRHQTVYTYEDPVQLSHNLAHLCPMERPFQKVESFKLEVEPEPAVATMREDAWGNRSHFLLVQEAHREFRIVATSMVRLESLDPIDPEATSSWEDVASRVRNRPVGRDVHPAQFRHASPFVPMLAVAREYALESFPEGQPVMVGAMDLMGRVYRQFRYDPEATTVATPLAEVFEKRRGVCQDFSHAMIGSLRSLGIPARYVSGYLETRPPPGKPRLIGADASHAWVQVWCPETGWVDLDPTNDVAPSQRHITVAIGRDFGDVTPLKGLLLGGGGQKVRVSVDVEPLG